MLNTTTQNTESENPQSLVYKRKGKFLNIQMDIKDLIVNNSIDREN